MQKIFSKLVTVVLGLVCLGGCFMENKESKVYMDRHFSYLEKVYPTKNVEELFEKFPEGANLVHSKSFSAEDKAGRIAFRYHLTVSSKDKKIYGTETKEVYSDKAGEQVKTEYVEDVEYRNGKIYYVTKIWEPKELRFLFEMIDYNEIIREGLKRVHYAMWAPLYSISYWMKKDNFANILGETTSDKFYISFKDNGNKQAEVFISEYGTSGKDAFEYIERTSK